MKSTARPAVGSSQAAAGAGSHGALPGLARLVGKHAGNDGAAGEHRQRPALFRTFRLAAQHDVVEGEGKTADDTEPVSERVRQRQTRPGRRPGAGR